MALQNHIRTPETGIKKEKASNLFLFGIIVFAIVLTMGFWIIDKRLPINLFWGTMGLILGTTLFILYKTKKITLNLFSIAAISFIVLDLGGVDFCSF